MSRQKDIWMENSDHQYTSPRMTKVEKKRPKISSARLDMNNSHSLLAGTQGGTATLENNLACIKKFKHTFNIHPRNPIPR